MPENEQAIILELLEGRIIKYETRRWSTQRRNGATAQRREIHIHSWRVIYHIQTNRKFVLTLFHKRRDLTSDDNLLSQ
jgi:mRNA-degrading endonuclease RelE of RelBE toxin-antitoxin system